MHEPVLEGAAELAEDARALLAELDREAGGVSSLTAECRPPIDVRETATSIELVMDLPGITASTVRVAVRRQTVLVVGAKPGAPADRATRFHVAERSYGRFARAVRLTTAVDASRATAAIARGELRIVLPRVTDRRGQQFRVPVVTA